MATTTTHNTYGAPVSLEAKRSAASKYKKKVGLGYPLVGGFKKVTGQPPDLQNNTSEGGYFGKSSGLALIKNNLRQLLLCEKGERVMLPNYGMSLQRFLFEPLDETTYYLIKNSILRTLSAYFGVVKVISLQVFSSGLMENKNQLVISLTLQLLDESLDVFDVEVTIR